jgi:hypothetical protein
LERELIRDIGQIVISLAILGFAGYLQVATGEIPAPWDLILLAALAALGVGDGVRLVIKRTNNKAVSVGLEKEQ